MPSTPPLLAEFIQKNLSQADINTFASFGMEYLHFPNFQPLDQKLLNKIKRLFKTDILNFLNFSPSLKLDDLDVYKTITLIARDLCANTPSISCWGNHSPSTICDLCSHYPF